MSTKSVDRLDDWAVFIEPTLFFARRVGKSSRFWNKWAPNGFSIKEIHQNAHIFVQIST